MNRPVISVIMASYNPVPQYFERAVKSIIYQTFQGSELIIIDDHSKMPVKDICKQFTDDERIRYIRLEENCGRSFARNVGLAESRGKYLMFLDDDDWIDRNKFHKHISILSKGYNFVYSDYVFFTPHNEFLMGKYNYRLKYFVKDPFFHMACNTNLVIHLPIFDRDLIKIGKTSFFENISFFEDWAFYLLLILMNEANLKCYYINEVLNFVQAKKGRKITHKSLRSHIYRYQAILALMEICKNNRMGKKLDILKGVLIYHSIPIRNIKLFFRPFSLKAFPSFLFCVYRTLEAWLTRIWYRRQMFYI